MAFPRPGGRPASAGLGRRWASADYISMDAKDGVYITGVGGRQPREAAVLQAVMC